MSKKNIQLCDRCQIPAIEIDVPITSGGETVHTSLKVCANCAIRLLCVLLDRIDSGEEKRRLIESFKQGYII